MFASPRKKIEWADHHIAKYERIADDFLMSRPNRFDIETDPDGIQYLRIRFVKNLPSEIPLVVADAIHNLRTALDHAAWELAAIGNGTQDRRTQFITGNDRVNFEATCRRIKTPSQWVIDAFLALEAFPGGKGHQLRDLAELDNADKHTVITPALRVVRHPPIRIVTGDGYPVYEIESPPIMGADGETIRAVGAHHGLRIEMEDEVKGTTSIFLEKPNGEMEPIRTLLRNLRSEVQIALVALENASAANSGQSVP